MALSSQPLSSFCCEIKILGAKNLDFKSHGNLFVRYYLSAGTNRRIQLNSKEISTKSNLFWNESFSLECSGTEDSVNNLKQEGVVFELRWRNTSPFLGKIGGSQLLGRAEIPWEAVMESPEMEMEKWVMMVNTNKKSCVADGVKPPSVKIAMSVRAPMMVELQKKRTNGRAKKWEECGCCKDCDYNCGDYYDMFALGAALEAL